VPEFLLVSLAQARLLLAQGERAGAAHVLAARQSLAAEAGFGASLVETHAMLALCVDSEKEVAAHLEQALDLDAISGHVRAFLDLGQPMAERLRWASERGIAVQVALKLLAAFEDVTASAPSLAPQPAPAAPSLQSLVEPLSDRELAVLRLLDQDHTYQEIAQALYVSLNTVKTHVKHVYAKLQVHTRRQATGKAQELGLL
jgi:LuxR family maltose regulon positive regulatory protein